MCELELGTGVFSGYECVCVLKLLTGQYEEYDVLNPHLKSQKNVSDAAQ